MSVCPFQLFMPASHFCWRKSILLIVTAFSSTRRIFSTVMSGEGIAAYDRPNFRRMRQEHYELLLKVETESGQKLPQIEDMSAGCLVANITPNIGVRFLLASSLKGNWGIPKGN